MTWAEYARPDAFRLAPPCRQPLSFCGFPAAPTPTGLPSFGECAGVFFGRQADTTQNGASRPAKVQRMNAGNWVRVGVGVLAMLAAGTVMAADAQPWQLNMTPGVTDTSAQVYWLHNLILGICVVIGILVF